MLAREYCHKNKDVKTPVIVSHHMLSGMTAPKTELKKANADNSDEEAGVANKMSKSNPNSAIFMEDSEAEVNKKIKIAYCPPAMEFEGENRNPILDYCESIIFPSFGEMKCERKPENGGDIIYANYAELKESYCAEKLHPSDLKTAVAIAINKLLKPVRDHFENDPYARGLLEQIKIWQEEFKKQAAKEQK